MGKYINILGKENAHVTQDYPYGFHNRTQRREWIETDPKIGKIVAHETGIKYPQNKGQRFCTQTLNPATLAWNKPKCSTYSDVMVGVVEFDPALNKDVVTYNSLRLNASKEKIDGFRVKYKDVLTPYQLAQLEMLEIWDAAMKKLTWKIHEPTPEEQAAKQQYYEEHNKWLETRKIASQMQPISEKIAQFEGKPYVPPAQLPEPKPPKDTAQTREEQCDIINKAIRLALLEKKAMEGTK